MTRKTSFNNSDRRTPLVTPRYMFATARRGWALIVLFFIIFLLFFTVPAMMGMADLRDYFYYNSQYHLTRKEIVDRIMNTVFMLRGTFVVLSIISAVFAGGYFMTYLHNKVSAGFYHSLPERRSGHFISAVFAATVTYLIAAITNFILVLFIFAVNGFLYAEVVPTLLSIAAYGIFYFFVFLSVAVLAGAVSGTATVHTLMTGFILFALPAIYLSTMLLFKYAADANFIKYLYVNNMATDFEVYKWLSPVFRAVYVLIDYDTPPVVPQFVMVLVDAVMMILAFALAYYAYSKRPIERSGTPIIYGWLSETVKYIIMAPSAVLLSYLFGEFAGYNVSLWSVFGFFAGLLISFMLCNTVLNRSAKAMFSHAKGMLIYSGVFTVVAVILITGIFGLPDRIVPNADSITIYMYGQRVTLTDKEELGVVRAALKEIVRELDTNGAKSQDVYHMYSFSDKYESAVLDGNAPNYIAQFDKYAGDISRTINVSVDYKKTFGASFRYNYGNVDYSSAGVLIEALLKCDGYFEQLSPGSDFSLTSFSFDITASTSHVIDYCGAEFGDDEYMDKLRGRYMLLSTYSTYFDEMETNDAERMKNAILDVFTPSSVDYYQRHAIGSFHSEYYVPKSSYYYYNDYSYPLYFDDFVKLSSEASDIMDKLYFSYPFGSSEWLTSKQAQPSTFASMTFDQYIDGIAEAIDEIDVYCRSTGETVKYTGGDIRSIIPHLAAINPSDISPLARTDDDYVVLVKTHDLDYEDIETYVYDDQAYPATPSRSDYHTYYITWFLEGDIPATLR